MSKSQAEQDLDRLRKAARRYIEAAHNSVYETNFIASDYEDAYKELCKELGIEPEAKDSGA